MKTLALAFASLFTLSGAAMATDSIITINQQSSGGVFLAPTLPPSTPPAVAARTCSSPRTAPAASRPRRTCARVRGDAVGTVLQTGGVNNRATMNLTAPRGTADGVLVQNASRSNQANVNLRAAAPAACSRVPRPRRAATPSPAAPSAARRPTSMSCSSAPASTPPTSCAAKQDRKNDLAPVRQERPVAASCLMPCHASLSSFRLGVSF